MNVSDKTTSSWENERTYPDVGSLVQLSELLNLSLDELIKEDMNMVNSIDENLEEGRKWKKWRWIIFATSILISFFILINIVCFFWTNHRLSQLDNYSWSQENLPEKFINFPSLYEKKNDLYVFLSKYQTKHSISYLQFDNAVRQVTVRREDGYSLWIKEKNEAVFFDGKGNSLTLDSEFNPIQGKEKSNDMNKNMQQEFLKEYKKDIVTFYSAGILMFEDWN